MTSVLVLNGEPPTASQLRDLAEWGLVFAADGGARCCLEHGVRPELVVGDFDSLDLTQLPEDWKVIHRPDQNATDFQKVLSILPGEPDELIVLGGLGARLDHTLTNLLIAGSILPRTRIQFVGATDMLIRVTPETPFEAEFDAEQTLSLLPLQQVEGVTTTGLKWNLSDQTMGPGGQLGQSNWVQGPVSIRVTSGWIWIWMRQNV